MTWLEVRRELATELGSDAEARWLIEEVFDRHPDATSEHRLFELRALVDRRLAGVPLQYVIGHWSFRTLDLVVDPRVLIPRPETEQVVEVALAELRRSARDRPDPVLVDLGTGSGAVALSLAVEGQAAFPRLQVWATDADEDALAVAALNRVRVGAGDPRAAERVVLRRGSWWHSLPASLQGALDLVVCNPPYVGEGEWAELDAEVRLEPYRALVARDGLGGIPGMAEVEAVLAGAPDWLAPAGALVVEIAPHQSAAAIAAARRAGLRSPRVERDLAARERVLVAESPR
ncbi:MAG TPA: HemK/PrmC family methyltransferase [Acidimicrobiales bacterium]|nr:HemK/PrmC family methyltransferase [Acidimicrobiales bacterium]